MNLGTETGTQINSLKSSASAGEVSPLSKAQMSRRGRRAVPALKNARFALAQAQREVARHEKAVRKAAEVVGSTVGSAVKGAATKSAEISAKSTAVLNKARTLLKAAKSIEEKAIKALASVISAEAAKSRLMAHVNALKTFKGKLEKKSDADLAKALARFEAGWRKKRRKVVEKKRMPRPELLLKKQKR